eukprot:gene17927-18161_t
MPAWVGDDPVENGWVYIGWPRLGDILKIPATREAYKEALARFYPEKKPGAIPVDAGTLLRFAHEIQAGDVLVYPSKHNRMVNIGRANGKRGYEATPDNGEEDLPNWLGVDWLGHYPREEFRQAALNEIGSFITLFAVRNNGAEFLNKVGLEITRVTPTNQADEAPLPDDDEVTQTTSQVAEESAADFIIRRLHKGVTGYEFEPFVAHLMECMGYTARVTKKSADGGVDVIAHTDPMGFQPPIIKIQCKRQITPVGEPLVSQLLGTLGKGEFALFVTLGSYTASARARERNTPSLRLVDGEQLVEMIQAAYPKISPRYRRILPLKQIYVPDLTGE